MKYDVPVKNGITIPEAELNFKTSRSGGPGGQHVNKTSTRITIHWNVTKTTALTQEQKEWVIKKLQSRLTIEGEIVVHNNDSRSQHNNKLAALAQLGHIVRKALHVPKKRIATKASKTVKEKRLKAKKQRSDVKKNRSTKYYD